VFGITKRELWRRSAIEPVIGHTAVGDILRRVLAWLKALLGLILIALWQAFAAIPTVRWAS
jgi:hypothetical protein